MKSKTYIFGTITILWCAVIFWFSIQSGEESGDMSMSVLVKFLELFLPKVAGKPDMIPPEHLEVWHFVLRKCAHFGEYFVLGMLSRQTLCYTEWKRKMFVGLLFCICVAGIDEMLQLFVSGRFGSVWDMLIDSLGAVAGTFLMVFLVRSCKRWKRVQLSKKFYRD